MFKISSFGIVMSLLSFSFLLAQPKSDVKHPEWSRNATIYEVNIRQYTEEGTFNAFAESLPRLKEMGVKILWFMPIHPIGEKNRKGSLGSYYAVKDYKAVNPEFGTLDDFKTLVKKAHSMGMYVIIDWVANHTAWDHIWVKTHPEYYNKDENGNFFPPVDGWQDVIDLNYDNKELWRAMIDALKYWVEECDIDGYRCDVAAMVPTEFWNEAREELDKIKNVFMLAEAHEPELHEHAFDMTYNWQLKDLMNSIAKGDKSVKDLRKLISEERKRYPIDAYRMNFTTNHDENTWNGTVFERLGEGAEAFAALTVLIEGMPLVYSGQETGLNKRLAFFEKDPIDWKEHPFAELYKRLLNLKLSNKALLNGAAGGKLQEIKTNHKKEVFAFIRQKDDDKVFAVFNLSGKTLTVKIKSQDIKGVYFNLNDTKQVEFKDNALFELKPWGYNVFFK